MSRTDHMTEFDERVVAEAEADLDRLLAIEPSPEFVAKVRARIAAEPPARRWHWGRLLVPVAAAACLVLVVVQWNGRRHDEGPVATGRQGDIVLHRATPTDVPADVTARLAADVTPPTRRAAAPLQREPEITIDPSMAEAIRRLAVGARNTTLDGSKGESIAAPDSASETLPIAEDLNVPEIVLKPADQTGGQ
jgi:hypothetical protein